MPKHEKAVIGESRIIFYSHSALLLDAVDHSQFSAEVVQKAFYFLLGEYSFDS
jgi:hypothetical protein